MKIAVVTPYYRENADILRQCHESVLAQTISCQHIMVADGHPADLFDASPRTDHVILPRANGDNGNTPRGIGSMLAASWGYDAVAYLDADNWYAPQHIETLINAVMTRRAPIGASKRTFHTLEGALMPISEVGEERHEHVDTSCYLITRPAFELFPFWFMPKELGPVCDRIIFHAILRRGLQIAFTDERTVAFRSQYAQHYEGAGMTPPPDAKTPNLFEGPLAYLNDEANHPALLRQFGFIPGR